MCTPLPFCNHQRYNQRFCLISCCLHSSSWTRPDKSLKKSRIRWWSWKRGYLYLARISWYLQFTTMATATPLMFLISEAVQVSSRSCQFEICVLELHEKIGVVLPCDVCHSASLSLESLCLLNVADYFSHIVLICPQLLLHSLCWR